MMHCTGLAISRPFRRFLAHSQVDSRSQRQAQDRRDTEGYLIWRIDAAPTTQFGDLVQYFSREAMEAIENKLAGSPHDVTLHERDHKHACTSCGEPGYPSSIRTACKLVHDMQGSSFDSLTTSAGAQASAERTFSGSGLDCIRCIAWFLGYFSHSSRHRHL